jgi:hypothetical protein
MQLYLESDDVRYILQNAGRIKKNGTCINCGGTGWKNWNAETGNEIKHGQSDNIDRDSDECEKCQGVGYTW